MPSAQEHTDQELRELGELLLDIGALLMSNGASTARIRLTVDRIASSFGCTADLLITHRALTLALGDSQRNQFFNSLKRTSPHGVNFKLVSGISRMSWRVVEGRWNLAQTRADLNRLLALPHYPRLVVLGFVALAGASFCRLAGGTAVEMLIAGVATFAGLFVRQEALRRQFNPYLCVFSGACTAALAAGFFTRIGLSIPVEHAFATSVLFLIPGVPLINSFTDLLDGNILNGLLRLVHGLMLAFMIALGLLVAIWLYKI